MTKARRRTFFRHTPTEKAAEAAELDAAVAAWEARGGQILRVQPAPAPARAVRQYRLHPDHIGAGSLPKYQGGTPWAEEWGVQSPTPPGWY